MTASRWLRVSSVISFVFAAGHSLGGRHDWSPVGDSNVLREMAAYRFDVAGVSRTYLEFYRGFGWSLTAFLLLQAVLLWQLAAVTRAHASLGRPMIAAVIVANVALGLIEWRLILPPPVLFSAVLIASLTLAFVATRGGVRRPSAAESAR